MSVPSELLLNTQNSFQTHAQRGANIVMRGGKRKSRRKKGGGSGFGVDVTSGIVMGCNSTSGTFGDCGKARNKAVNDQDDYGKTWIQYNLDWIDSTKSEKEKVQGLNRLNNFIVNMNESPRFEKVYFPGWPQDEDFMNFNNRFKEFNLPILVRVGNMKDWTKNRNYNEELRVKQNESKKTGGKRKSKRTKRMARKSRRKSRRNQRGGRGRTITYANLDFMANNRLGKMVPHGDAYTNCNTQTGGGGYGFTKEGASASETFKGGYPVFTKYEKSNQCGGKRRRRRKSRKSRKSKRKSRRKSRKSRRKRRKSRRRRRRRRKAGSPDPDEGRLFQRGGSSHTYGSPVAVGSKPWATAPLGIQANKPSCYDNYNHYKGL